jgi:hypothetical protein
MGLLSRVGVLVLGTASIVVVAQGTAVAQSKEVRGQVLAVSDSSLAVRAGEKALNFLIDKDTIIEANGAGTRTREAKAAGKESAGIKVTDYVKAGGAVLVSYREVDGKNRALIIRSISSAGSGGEAAANVDATKNVLGTVKSISGARLILDQGGHDMTFTIDRQTDVLARGGTRATKNAGGKVPITDIVHVGDLVRVQYRDVNGAMNAFEVQLRNPDSVPAK